jgi:hypothetical protein
MFVDVAVREWDGADGLLRMALWVLCVTVTGERGELALLSIVGPEPPDPVGLALFEDVAQGGPDEDRG